VAPVPPRQAAGAAATMTRPFGYKFKLRREAHGAHSQLSGTV
jgi:hypothetical protein